MQQMQLVFETIQEHQNHEQVTYRRFLMLDYLERLQERTALIHYNDGFIKYSVPVRIGLLNFSSFPKSIPEICGFKASDSAVLMKKSPESLTVEANRIRAIHHNNVWGTEKRKGVPGKFEEIPGIAQIELKDFDPLTWKKANPLKESFHPTSMIGKTIQLVLATPEDWITKVQSLPITVKEFQLTGRTLRIAGSNGAEIDYKGVVSVRTSEDSIIVDIRDPIGNMGQSLHIWHKSPTYL